MTIPNGEFSSLQLENFAARDRIRFHASLGLRYETSADQLRHVLIALKALLVAHARVTDDPARVRFVGFGAYSLDLEVVAYVDTSDWSEFLAIREELMLQIIDLVEASGTGFAFPSQTIYLGQDGGLDAERTRAAETEVEAQRARSALCLPDYPPERLRELENTVPYPPAGAALAPAPERGGTP
jgi:MscS family membrane protein